MRRSALFVEESILAPLQGSWIGEAKTEGLAREICTKFIDPHPYGQPLRLSDIGEADTKFQQTCADGGEPRPCDPN